MNATVMPTTPLNPADPRLRQPLFTVRETAGHLGLPATTVHRWARADVDPLVATVQQPRGAATVPFVGFAEAFVLSAFRKAGVPMQRIRPAVDILRREIGLEHALASHELYTDGTEILMNYEPDQFELTVVRTGQKQFSEVVQGYLQRVTYGSDGWIQSIELPTYHAARVRVDPTRAFGLPLLVEGGARVEDIVDRFVAGDSLTDLSRDFAVPADQIEDVIRVATKSAAPT